jgi:translation initiation factor IF-3
LKSQGSKTYWRINKMIHAPRVRVIDENGKQVGVMTTDKALVKAQRVKLDLIEIAPNANPPVARILDFGKFKYQQRKQEQTQKKGVKRPDLKEIRFSPFIGESDYRTRIERIKEFLNEKNKIKVVVKFKGRQMGSKKFGYDLLKKILAEVGERVNVDMEPKFVGRHLTMIISPTSKIKKSNAKT